MSNSPAAAFVRHSASDSSANASPPLFFTISGPGLARILVPASAGTAFPSPRKEGLERREAPGSLLSLPDRPCDRPVRAKIPGPIGFEGGGGPGARGPLRRGPAPPGAPTRCQLSGTAFCSRFGRRDRRRPPQEQNRNIYRACGAGVNPRTERPEPPPADSSQAAALVAAAAAAAAPARNRQIAANMFSMSRFSFGRSTMLS